MDAPDRALRRLRDAYGAGDVSTDTLEARATLALTGHADKAIWDLPDLGSVNGTLLNGRRVRRSRLRPGDRLEVGVTLIDIR